jgi:hypothetical protein
MIYGHLIDDYVLQDVLAKLKQKKFWEDNAPDKLYKNDYKIALVCHALEWSISIHIAQFLYIIHRGLLDNRMISLVICLSIVINAAIHYVIDDTKANKLKINLIQDQLLHLLQIGITYIVLLKLMIRFS